jgi:hypothetical protein
MSNPIAAECSEMVSDDIAMDEELMTIDCYIRHREWDTSLRILPISPTDRIVNGARTSRQRGI